MHAVHHAEHIRMAEGVAHGAIRAELVTRDPATLRRGKRAVVSVDVRHDFAQGVFLEAACHR
jgi:hypothetical protein